MVLYTVNSSSMKLVNSMLVPFSHLFLPLFLFEVLVSIALARRKEKPGKETPEALVISPKAGVLDQSLMVTTAPQSSLAGHHCTTVQPSSL